MVKKQKSSADPGTEPKKPRRVALSPADTGVDPSDCIEIYLVSSKEEVGSPGIPCVNPVELNDFFLGDGKIYGYEDLKIIVWMNSISLHSYADITYKSSTYGDKGITDLQAPLQRIFGDTLVDNKDEFLLTFSTERDLIRNMVSNGEVIHSGAIEGSSNNAEIRSNLQVLRMGICSPNAGALYCRLVPLVLLFVDGGNPIDVTDPDWHLYLLVQKEGENKNPLYRIVGFTAVYQFYRYPDRLRMRLSQILVLPSFQGKGHGSYLLEVVNKVAITENVYDLTVEEPSERFQYIRTCVDINRLRGFEPIKTSIDSAVQILTQEKLLKKAQISRFTPPLSAIESVRESLKINKKQFLKCWEILIYLALNPIVKYMENYTAVITDNVRADILGKNLETPNKQMVDVPSSYEPEGSFVVFKSLSGEEANSNMEVDENQPGQEQQLKQLVEERIREIKLVADKVSQNCPEIMADSESMEVHPCPQEDSPRPQKVRKLDKPGEESKTTSHYDRLRIGDPESDEYMRQYLLFYYDFHRTQGFGIEWDKFDFFFVESAPCDGTPRFNGNQTNQEVIEEITLRAIAKYNKENGTNIVFEKHIEANYAFHGYMEFWITFWAKDMSSPSPESKIYQANTLERSSMFSVPIFRIKPTDEEMAAAPIKVDLPRPIRYDCDKPPVAFSLAGPEDDQVPGTPYTFNRNPPPEEEEKEEEEEEEEEEDDDESEVGIETESDVK